MHLCTTCAHQHVTRILASRVYGYLPSFVAIDWATTPSAGRLAD